MLIKHKKKVNKTFAMQTKFVSAFHCHSASLSVFLGWNFCTENILPAWELKSWEHMQRGQFLAFDCAWRWQKFFFGGCSLQLPMWLWKFVVNSVTFRVEKRIEIEVSNALLKIELKIWFEKKTIFVNFSSGVQRPRLQSRKLAVFAQKCYFWSSPTRQV